MVMIALGGCKKWDDHIAPTEAVLDQTLTEAIAQRPNLSRLSEYLKKTGLDKMLSEAGTYTIWAPDNTALDALPADVKADTAKLKKYLFNHIAGLQYYTAQVAAAAVRVPMMNGKRVSFFNKKFDDANVTEADRYLKNGVLQVVDKAIAPLQNINEYIGSTTATYQQNAFVASLVYQKQDPSLAQLDSINPLTGNPVYKPGTGMVTLNAYSNLVYDLGKEDSLYTYIILTNAGYGTEKTRQAPFFKSATAGIADTNAAWNVVKDLAFRGSYTQDQLPAALVSKFGVNVPVNKAEIVASYKLSNGMVYVMNTAAAPLAEKIPTVTVQGASPVAYSSTNTKLTNLIFLRQQLNPTTGLSFRDLYASLGSSGPSFQVRYLTNSLYSTTYKVYYMALNNKIVSGQGDDPYGTDSIMQQSMIMSNVLIGNAASYTTNHIDTLKMKVIQNTYTETYLGDFKVEQHNAIIPGEAVVAQDISPGVTILNLTAPPSGTLTGIPYNLTLGYLKLVPVVQ
jgi:uncharacterized surface protein with fasciclin (FAS1) repeats